MTNKRCLADIEKDILDAHARVWDVYRRGDKAISRYDLMMGYDTEFYLNRVPLLRNHLYYFKAEYIEFCKKEGIETNPEITKLKQPPKTGWKKYKDYKWLFHYPKGKPLPEVLKTGYKIKTDLSGVEIVKEITGPFKDPSNKHAPPSYCVSLTNIKSEDCGHLNDLIAVNGKIVNYFKDSDDKITIVSRKNHLVKKSVGRFTVNLDRPIKEKKDAA